MFIIGIYYLFCCERKRKPNDNTGSSSVQHGDVDMQDNPCYDEQKRKPNTYTGSLSAQHGDADMQDNPCYDKCTTSTL